MYKRQDLPQPTTVSEANSWLKSNVIYKGNVPAPTNCTMTAIQSGLTKAQLETRLNELMVCLMAVSYTHLDVYKRQTPSSSSRRTPTLRLASKAAWARAQGTDRSEGSTERAPTMPVEAACARGFDKLGQRMTPPPDSPQALL